MIVYLNGEYLPVENAKISPLDRGFLFGDGIYEAVPSYGGRTVALQLHIERMKNGLACGARREGLRGLPLAGTESP